AGGIFGENVLGANDIGNSGGVLRESVDFDIGNENRRIRGIVVFPVALSGPITNDRRRADGGQFQADRLRIVSAGRIDLQLQSGLADWRGLEKEREIRGKLIGKTAARGRRS